ncbi:MAG: hypothetical protein PF904_17755 [Kiritimatiellae bacterium]|jgi:alpha-acetolactate decarboxylase|nr:hypothetical protein [Kiritimatiellia bacterium]
MPLRITASRTVDADAGNITFDGSVDYDSGATTILTKEGAHEWIITGDTVHTGSVYRVKLDHGTVRFASGSRFHLSDPVGTVRTVFEVGDKDVAHDI